MSSFIEKKIKTFFYRFDVDGNGTIEEDDVEKWTEKLIVLRNISANKQHELREQMKHIWTAFFSPADVDGDGKVGYDELLNYINSLSNNHTNREDVNRAFSVIYDAIDVNHDGGISIDEFSIYFKSLGIDDENFIKSVFDEMDVNKDGSLSVDEFSQFGVDFFIGENESNPSRHFFGPVVE